MDMALNKSLLQCKSTEENIKNSAPSTAFKQSTRVRNPGLGCHKSRDYRIKKRAKTKIARLEKSLWVVSENFVQKL